jgi:hypothetical protein
VINLRSGRPGRLPPPLPDLEARLDARARAILERVLECAIAGGPQAVTAGLRDFIAAHSPDELMLTSQIFDHEKRLRSYEIVSGIAAGLQNG